MICGGDRPLNDDQIDARSLACERQQRQDQWNDGDGNGGAIEFPIPGAQVEPDNGAKQI